MPVPMMPHKGQMMSLREPAGGLGKGTPRQGGGIGMTRVFFAEECYIIPKMDGRIVVGSTVEVKEEGLLCGFIVSWRGRGYSTTTCFYSPVFHVFVPCSPFSFAVPCSTVCFAVNKITWSVQALLWRPVTASMPIFGRLLELSLLRST